MNPQLIGITCIVVLLVLMYTRMWIGFVMLLVGFCGLIVLSGWHQALSVLSIVPYNAIGDYTFSAIPVFFFMGSVLVQTGLGSELFYTANKWIGQYRGGLAMATVVAAAVLGVITYSMIACIILAKVAIPEMKKYDYDDSLASASVLCGASLASLIPPSIGFILFGMLTGTSVGKLYIAGVVPGICLMVLMVILVGITVNINKKLASPSVKTTFKEKLVSLKQTWALIIIFGSCVLGIYFGVFTPTEGGAVGSAATIVIGLITRKLNFKKLTASILETAEATAMITLLVSGAFVFMKTITLSNIPFTLANFIAGLHVSKYLVLLFIAVIYIIFGMFSDIMACIFLTVPIIFPLVTVLGVDPLWFGVFVVILIEMGFISPPIGMNAFMLSGITKIPLNKIFKGSWSFLGVMALFLIIITIFPKIVLWLPGTMVR